MQPETLEQRLKRLLEIKNRHVDDAQKDLRMVFSILKELRDEIESDLTDDQLHSLSDAMLATSGAFMTLLEVQTIDKYWNLDQ